jgi:thymidylate kinase
MLVAAANGLGHARAAAGAAAAGRVVVFDRYVLDSRVRLRFLYGEGRAYGSEDALVRWLSPRPRAAFLLELAPQASLARKEDRWSLRDLEHLGRLYAELDEGGVVRLGATRPADDLADEIARTVWLRL